MTEKRVIVNQSGYVQKTRFDRSILFLAVLSIFALLVLIGGYYAVPQVELKGDSVVTLNYKEKYQEAGYEARIFNRDISSKVKVSGKVDVNKLGTYKINYELEGILKKKITRTVKVKDLSEPVIELDDKDIYLCPGTKYSTSEVKAYDNYDGDISKNVKVDIGQDSVVYSVEDSSKNKKSVVKKIIYLDNVSPEITLKGSQYVYAFLNEGYTDLGVSANDNCLGDVSSRVVVENKVDTSKTGKYEVKYSVTDDSGNNSVKSRTVIVSERGRAGTIYLTFDDGPQNGTTDTILDILKEEGVEATFFVTNKGPDGLIRRMYDEGHTVALHTATHNYEVVYASVDSYFNDLNSVNERVKRITGEYSHIIRFPGGSSNTISRRYSQGIMSILTEEVVNRGYRYYDWNISSGDAAGGSPTPEQIRNNVVNSLRKDRVNMVLMHDIKTYTRDALKDIIKYGKDNGYTFEKITMSTEMVRQRVNN